MILLHGDLYAHMWKCRHAHTQTQKQNFHQTYLSLLLCKAFWYFFFHSLLFFLKMVSYTDFMIHWVSTSCLDHWVQHWFSNVGGRRTAWVLLKTAHSLPISGEILSQQMWIDPQNSALLTYFPGNAVGFQIVLWYQHWIRTYTFTQFTWWGHISKKELCHLFL